MIQADLYRTPFLFTNWNLNPLPTDPATELVTMDGPLTFQTPYPPVSARLLTLLMYSYLLSSELNLSLSEFCTCKRHSPDITSSTTVTIITAKLAFLSTVNFCN